MINEAINQFINQSYYLKAEAWGDSIHWNPQWILLLIFKETSKDNEYNNKL